MLARLLSKRREVIRSPMTWILFVIALLRGVALWWGLPASDGWDTDGVAPRDFLPGLAQSFTPGQFYTYPPVHLAILAVLTLPITLVAFIRAPSTAISAVVQEIIKVPYMTAMAMTARVVSLAMSLAIVVFIARIAEEISAYALDEGTVSGDKERARLTGYVTAAFVGVNVSLSYYGHTSNLDVPYMFWGSWSLLYLTRALTRSEPRLFRRAFLFAVLAIGTKDQAYALFLLSYPVALVVWFLVERETEKRSKALRELGIALLLAIGLFLIVDCVIVNPSGFRARVAFLTGSASQDYASYTNDWNGRGQILTDAARGFRWHYPLLAAPIVLLGVVRAVERSAKSVEARAKKLVVALLPLLAAMSFMIAFNFTARRSDPRFLLPESVMLGVYGGLGIEWLITPVTRWVRLLGQAFVSIALAKAVFVCVALDVNMLRDPRYDAEEWLASHVKPGDVIETYGLNVYMPRLSSLKTAAGAADGVRVIRVGPEPVDKRNPMPGIEEVEAPFMNAPERGARFIVVNTGWVWRYYVDPEALLIPGKKLPPTQSRSASDLDGTKFFDELDKNAGAYERAHTSAYDDHVFPVVDIHGTTTRWVWIYERKKPR
jgi:hypothetical protein